MARAKRKRADPADPVTRYARDVVARKEPAGWLVRLACQRHLRDLKRAKKAGLVWDLAAALRAIKFFGCLRLTEGEHSGRPFTLSRFQKFIVGSIFGWKIADGTRRFRVAYVEIGKGNGKTPLAAGIGLYGLTADGEAGAQVYSAAVSREQAKLLFTDARIMAKGSPLLSRMILVNENNLAVLRTNSYFRPVSSEHKALDGKRVHMALIDELHEHPTPLVLDKMRAGTKGRPNALIFEITNSGYSRHTVCWDHHAYSVKVLEGSLEDDSWFAYVCTLDPCGACAKEGKAQPKDGCADCDDWKDPAVWEKANPNLGVSITKRYLTEQVREAAGMPSKQNIVRRLNFCEWTEQFTRWLSTSAWDECAGKIELERLIALLAGRRCYAGFDLSSTTDLTAAAFAFPPPSEEEAPDELGGRIALLWKFWIPGDNLAERMQRDGVPYDLWVRQGLIQTTPGNVVDYDFVLADFQSFADGRTIEKIGLDPWNATQFSTDLQNEGFEVVSIRQGFGSLSAPAKELARLVLSKGVVHGGNPVARWMAANVAIATDPAGNIKPTKAQSTGRIDGIVAGIEAIDLLTRDGGGESVYEGHGLQVLEY